jgi:Domain of unknown function (DUF4266)
MKLKTITRILRVSAVALAMPVLMASLSGCALVHQKDREYLSDRIMQREEDPLESALEGHDFPRREGSTGGSSGSGGGCGC